MSTTGKVICFGEVLLDVFPDEERIGGAPLNVASRLSSLGAFTQIISRVGADHKGKQIIQFLNEKGVGISHIQRDADYPTGVVNVTLSKSGSATYEIAQPVAWDKIQLTEENIVAVENSDLFVFGSLVCRDEVSRNSLMELLPKAQYRVLDFNLRPPHYNKELLFELINDADFIKFNDDELFEIAEMLNSPYHSLEQNIHFISRRSSATSICVTKGSHGAVLLRNDRLFYNSGYKINVKDTVGAGDSFLAGLLYKLLEGADEQSSLDFACALGALVAGEKGANPPVTQEQIYKFMNISGNFSE